MDVLTRFMANVDQSGGPDACHPWTGPIRNEKGYGSFRIDGRYEVAHRWLLGCRRGRPLVWPEEIGCHTCDNPSWCNPRHLYVGTHADNTRDAIERSGHPAAKRHTQVQCAHGHPYDELNTGFSAGRRYCKTCKRAQSKDNQRRARRARGLKRRTRRANGQFEWVAS